FVIDHDIERLDLSDIAHGPQELCRFGVAAADRDHVAASGQPLDDIAADKPGPAEHRGATTSHVLSHVRARLRGLSIAQRSRPAKRWLGWRRPYAPSRCARVVGIRNQQLWQPLIPAATAVGLQRKLVLKLKCRTAVL